MNKFLIKMKEIKAPLFNYLFYIKLEIFKPLNYVKAILIGLLINFLIFNSFFATYVAFLVPFFIQILTRSSMHYTFRYKIMLSQFPIEHDDPVFIIDSYGNIVLAGGKTKVLFSKHNVKHISDFFDKKSTQDFLDRISKKDPSIEHLEVYSKVIKKWYETKLHKTKGAKNTNNFLVWLNDITELKITTSKILTVLKYSNVTLLTLKNMKRRSDVIDHMPPFIIRSGYKAVFIVRENELGDLKGRVYKEEESSIIHSDEIIVDKASLSPIWISRRLSRHFTDNVKNYKTREAFEDLYPFDDNVKDFIGVPIDSFINYHEAEYSIIAFNKKYEYNKYDNMLIKTLVNNTRLIVSLLNLAISHEERFIQEVMGLCAAAEYTDKISGRHIIRVNSYSKFIAEKYGFDKEFIDTIGTVAALHDIGKVALPELIKKKEQYTQEERYRVQLHTIIGAQIIKKMINYSSQEDKKLKMAYNIALHHHQTWNGKGYMKLKSGNKIIEPESMDYKDYQQYENLSGDDIPIEALICSLADTYDALRSQRQYKDSFTHEKTVEIMTYDEKIKISGIDRFGPDLWNIFINNHEEFDHIYTTIL